jgi:hypothetical protein
VKRVGAGVLFLVLVVLANVLTDRFGMWGIAPAGTFAAGLVLLARDVVHDAAGRWWVLVCILAGAGLSLVLTDPRLAVASAVAFTVSELADLLVYQPLRRRGWARAVLLSGVAGAIVDSALFLYLAGFPMSGLSGQVAVKVGVTVLAVLAVKGVARAIHGNRVRAARA